MEDLCAEKLLLNDLHWTRAVVQHHGQLLLASLCLLKRLMLLVRSQSIVAGLNWWVTNQNSCFIWVAT